LRPLTILAGALRVATQVPELGGADAALCPAFVIAGETVEIAGASDIRVV
jgi:hypothetical protein